MLGLNLNKKHLLLAGIVIGLLWFVIYFERCGLIPEFAEGTAYSPHLSNNKPGLQNMVSPQGLHYKQPSMLSGRTDIVTVTPWLAPIVWEGTFDPLIIDNIYKPMNITIATTVFAVGKYTRYVKDFLETAEKHFLVGYNVTFYIFTDQPGDVPAISLVAGRQVKVLQVPSSNRWQEISARRMEIIQKTIEDEVRGHADYIFCLDVDSKFHGYWGAESLGQLVAVIHPGYYDQGREKFPYERRPASRAYIGEGEGDFYYGGAVIGGQVENVYELTVTCRRNFEADAADKIEAAWQEESHLNRYFLYNKPTKVLSPEYLWQDFKPKDNVIRVIRFSGVIKNYEEVRPNK